MRYRQISGLVLLLSLMALPALAQGTDSHRGKSELRHDRREIRRDHREFRGRELRGARWGAIHHRHQFRHDRRAMRWDRRAFRHRGRQFHGSHYGMRGGRRAWRQGRHEMHIRGQEHRRHSSGIGL